MLALSELNIYPVKSLGGQSLLQSTLDRFGLEGDRRWLVVDSDDQFLSQRELPQMATLQTQHDANGLVLRGDGEQIGVATPVADAQQRQVRVWGDSVVALDAGPDAAQWLSQRLGRDCRLVYMPDTCRRAVDPDYARQGETVSFADGFPLLLIGSASLEAFNRHLQAPISMNRFRPNLVVSGAEPYAEDSWRRLRIGVMEFDLVKPCSRCVMPAIDQSSGRKQPEVLKALAQHRRGADRKTYFGQNLLYRQSGSLAVGDAVTVLE
ncbi:MOSC domain-containing protein [Halieaceae bacterium IMCC14734]|uniref:MOSC domain-containing protein n=1 Tax=Candidatus Litorirhabdus singularis TaxID=2518993 RepID=A0ABT3TLQ5_9GAMM|nr:MOSC domain-containing protein [Candidatus Litorirhabdus singularis]MCX2982636.1 MOSC domain-containing protein [Candidatus Litorirhabdus singularis]